MTPLPSKPATLRDVAKAAGVSVSTASKALGTGVESGRISEDCRRRVRQACAELGYAPNHVARSLQAGRSFAIGTLLVDGLGDDQMPFVWGAISAGMAAAAVTHGCQLVTLGTRSGDSPVDVGLRMLAERRIDALVVPGLLVTSPVRKRLEAVSAPIVFVGYPHPTTIPSVVADDLVGTREIARHLAGLGHRHVLWVGARDPNDWWLVRRRQAFLAAATEFGMTPTDFVFDPPAKPSSLQQQIDASRRALLASPASLRTVTAAVGYNEALGLGIYAAAADLGRRIPADLSVASVDDIYAQAAYPAMTVVNTALREVGFQSVELAIAVTSPEARISMKRTHKKVPSRLVVRDSTGPAGRRGAASTS